jgi:predicted TIM-barrel fold metal-dependent hydrolase
VINDAHCHFFSTQFFETLSRQRGRTESAADICRELQWDDPGSAFSLAERWVRELDANGIVRAALIASVPGDESSVAAAVRRFPERFVGYFMLDPSGTEAVERTRRALGEYGLKGVCLFPAMHSVALDDARVHQVVGSRHPRRAPRCSCTAACSPSA